MLLFEFTETLLERAHDILFHVTKPDAAASILANKEFELGFTLAKDYAEKFRPKGSDKYFYLSTARSPNSGFIRSRMGSGNPQVLFELNGQWFNKHGYMTKPVDYFGGATNVLDKSDEMEDRVFSKEPTIKFNNAPELIKALHLYLPHSLSNHVAEYILPMVVQAKKQNVPLYVYLNGQAWLSHRKEKSFPYDKFIKAMKIELQSRKNDKFAKSPSVFANKYNEKGYQQVGKLEAKRAYNALSNLIQAKNPNDIKEDTFYVIESFTRNYDADMAVKMLFIKVKYSLGNKPTMQLVSAIKKSGISPDNIWDTLGRKWVGLSYGLNKKFDIRNAPKPKKYSPGKSELDLPF